MVGATRAAGQSVDLDTPRQDASARRPGRRAVEVVTAALDGVLDAVVGLLAVWTVVYHAALAFGWSRDTAALIWVASALATGAVVGLALDRRPPDVRADAEPVAISRDAVGAVVVAVVVLAASAGATVLHPPWWWIWWAGAVAVTGASTALAWRARVEPSAEPDGHISLGASGIAVVALVAVAFAVLSLVTHRPDADDVFLVNRATYVATHDGAFPTRDTIFSDQVFEAPRAELSKTSIEPLVGVAAAALGLTAPTVAYLLLAPAVSALGIFAQWRLLRTLRAPVPAMAVVGTALFLFLDGSDHASFGNFSFGRAWQGKTVFVFVLVPLLWHHALTWGRTGSRRSIVALAAANVAGIGLTSTSAFVAPLVTLLGVASSRPAEPRRWLGAGAALVYPLFFVGTQVLASTSTRGISGWLLGAANFLPVAGHPATMESEAQWYTVFGDGVGMGIAVVVAFATWLVVRDRVSRLALASAPLVVVVLFLTPGALQGIDALTGARSVLWRGLWVIPFPAAAGLALTAGYFFARREARLAAFAAAGLTLAVLLAFETPVVSADNRGMRIDPPRWDVDPPARAAATRLIELSEPGDVIAAPIAEGAMVAIMTADMHPVNPRNSYMTGDHVVAEFFPAERRLLSRAVERGLQDGEQDEFLRALDALSIGTVCTRPALEASHVVSALQAGGFAPIGRDDRCTYWRRA